jgi:hypothetical protein
VNEEDEERKERRGEDGGEEGTLLTINREEAPEEKIRAFKGI